MPGLKKTHSKTGRAKSDTNFSSYLGAHFFMVSLFSNLSTAHSHKTFFDQMIVVPPGSFGEIGRRPRNRRWRFHICSRETWIRQGEKPAERNCCPGKKNSMAKKLLIFFQAGPWTPEATVEHPDAVNYFCFHFSWFPKSEANDLTKNMTILI